MRRYDRCSTIGLAKEALRELYPIYGNLKRKGNECYEREREREKSGGKRYSKAMNGSKTEHRVLLSAAPSIKVYKSRSKGLVSYFSSQATFSTYGPLDGPVRLREGTSTPISPYSSSVDERANTSLTSDRILERIQPSVRNLIKTTRLWMQFEHARCDERRGSFHVVLVISNLLFRCTPL